MNDRTFILLGLIFAILHTTTMSILGVERLHDMRQENDKKIIQLTEQVDKLSKQVEAYKLETDQKIRHHEVRLLQSRVEVKVLIDTYKEIQRFMKQRPVKPETET